MSRIALTAQLRHSILPSFFSFLLPRGAKRHSADARRWRETACHRRAVCGCRAAGRFRARRGPCGARRACRLSRQAVVQEVQASRRALPVLRECRRHVHETVFWRSCRQAAGPTSARVQVALPARWHRRCCEVSPRSPVATSAASQPPSPDRIVLALMALLLPSPVRGVR